jgi:hypothetical protein
MGNPAYLIELAGLAPVPPSQPLIVMQRYELGPHLHNGAHAFSETSFMLILARGLAFQVKNELRQVFNRINIMVRRRRDQGMPVGNGAVWQ